jgi:hypothetical protein
VLPWDVTTPVFIINFSFQGKLDFVQPSCNKAGKQVENFSLKIFFKCGAERIEALII